MRMRLILTTVVLMTCATALVGPISAKPRQQNDSVAEAARKARARKKTPAKRPRVLTDDDLLPISNRGGVTSATASTSPATTTAPNQPADQRTDGQTAGKGEKFWRERFAEAYNKLHLAEAELNVLQREWNKGQVEYYPDPQKALKEQYTRKDINEHAQKIELKKKKIADLHLAIANLEDELRKAGGDVGWAREP